uniref:Uncharacterized protein n=1 Tax=Salarias fasciatus TaxID=181472 RepID=A0A672GGR6_SALFA
SMAPVQTHVPEECKRCCFIDRHRLLPSSAGWTPNWSVYLQDCPINHYIPIYLIVAGVFGLVLGVVTSCLPSNPEGEEVAPPTLLTRCCQFVYRLISLFLFCWFITGNVWIYSIYQPDYNKNTTNIDHYCDKTLYLFAFWTTNLVYIILGLSLVCGCCTAFFTCVLGCKIINDVETPS